MRLWLYICVAALCLVTLQVAAAPITVRSGAHDGFSRLVLDVPPGTEWAVENQDGAATVTLANHTDGFDIANIFNRIDQTHIASVEANNGFLDIKFSCTCQLIAFEQGTQMVVLDISEATTQPDAIGTLSAVHTDVTRDAPPLRFGPAILPVSSARARPLGSLQETVSEDGLSLVSPLIEQVFDPEAERLRQAQEQIASRLSAAAARGLVTPKKPTTVLPLKRTAPQIDTGIFDSSLPGLPLDDRDTTPDGGNLRITSSSDIPRNDDEPPLSTTLGMRCPDPKATAIQTWASDQPFSTQIAAHRNKLYSEFDRLNHDVAVDLAKTYLYFGFGAEARQILLMDAQLQKAHPALMGIAEIMEFGFAKTASYLSHFVECDTDVALWAILSNASVARSKQINVNAALRAVTALPMHLRRFIAPELSRRLLDYGKPDAAAAALRSLERSAEPLSPNANLAKATLDISEGKIGEGQDRLARIVSSNVEQSAAALIQFIDSHLDADARIDQSVATLVEGYALQFRDDPIGAELRRAHVLALGKSEQFDAAFDALDRVRERDAASMDISLKSSILELLTQNASDIEFLDHVFEQMSISLGSVDPNAKIQIADRLVDLGFAQEAETILAAGDDFPSTNATKLLRGRIALALGRPFETEALVYGLDTPDADKLRADAKAQSGAFEAAHALLEQLGEEESSQQTAWLANTWTTLIENDAPVFGDIARVAQTELPENTNLQGMLSRTTDAIAESAAARATIRDLLKTASGDADP